MKKNTNYIIALLALCVCLLSACADDFSDGWSASEGPVSMKITLNLPASSSTQTRATADELAAERRMNVEGMHLLIFEDDALQEDVDDKQLSNENGGSRTLTAKSKKSYKKTIEVVVLVNMNKNGLTFNGNSYIGRSKSEVYEALKYTYGNAAWNVVGNEKQYIPMWGKLSLTPASGVNEVRVSLYRAVSKMNVLVNNGDGLNNFTLKSVRVYYANQEGYAAPLVEPVSPESVETPSVENGFSQSTVTDPLVYLEEEGTKALMNRIYVAESNNKQPAEGKKRLCLVVGGQYDGAGLVDKTKESYYRVDFKDEDGFYDALRNHLYVFNIKSVSSPGTTTPEEALENAVVGMDVTIESWNDTYMNGLSSQYSLVTDKSRASFLQAGGEIAVTVRSDYGEPWTLVDVEGEWFDYEIRNNQVVLTADANYGASRNGSFCIQVGQLKKQIFVDQAQPGTANCYLANVGLNEMSVIVKGNGTFGLTAESKNGSIEQLAESAVLQPAYLSVIWETEEGLIKLVDAKTRAEVSERASYDERGVLTYRVKENPSLMDGNNKRIAGGNALIGAFDEAGNVIWSWHIWVCPEMLINGGNIDQYWGLTKYWVMDRNLGALSNQPGVGSLGLLYQWGRKDPFIGAAKISDNSDRMLTKNYLSHDWGVGAEKSIDYTVKNPTKLIHDGLSRGDKGAFLWGTDGGLAQEGIKDLGKKTIYDPCPVGYRVPPVDAFVFKGTKTFRPATWNNPPYTGSFKEEDEVGREMGRGSAFGALIGTSISVSGPAWVTIGEDGEEFFIKEGESHFIKPPVGGQIWYSIVPYKEIVHLKKTSENRNWDENLVYIPNNLPTVSSNLWNPIDYLYEPTEKAIENAPYFGYYVNYDEVSIPKMKEQGKDFYTLAPNQKSLTWLPLSGAYDPGKGLSFNGVTIEEGSSLTVNSFIWTNSSVKSSDGVTRPAALFLHGANPKKTGDGRHIHGLNKSDIKAEPHYAGAVRCVRDTKKDFGDENIVPTNISLGKNIGSTVTSQVIAINENWRVVDPGAPWVKITPDRGIADKGRGTSVTFTATSENTGSQPRTTTMKIQIGLNDIREVVITQN